MLKRLLVLLACLLPQLGIAAPKGFPDKFELTSLNIPLTWVCDDAGCGYEGTYQHGDRFYTLFFELLDGDEHRLWISGEDAWENSISFRYIATGDGTEGFYLYEDDSGYPFSDIEEPFSEFDFLEPIRGD
jgi:hypothetical protein